MLKNRLAIQTISLTIITVFIGSYIPFDSFTCKILWTIELCVFLVIAFKVSKINYFVKETVFFGRIGQVVSEIEILDNDNKLSIRIYNPLATLGKVEFFSYFCSTYSLLLTIPAISIFTPAVIGTMLSLSIVLNVYLFIIAYINFNNAGEAIARNIIPENTDKS